MSFPFRQVHTKAWSDNWFVDLIPEGKLLFLYLITNDKSTIAGIYELPLRTMVFETGLSLDVVKQQLDVFEAAEKAFYDYDAGVVWIVNLRKYHETRSPTVQAKIVKELAVIPSCSVMDKYCEAYGIDTVSIGYVYTYNLHSESDSRSNLSFEGPMPNTLSDSPPDQMIEALAEVTGMDAYVRANRTALSNAATQLVGRYQPEYVKARYGDGGIWFDENKGHWKGQKGQRPTLSDITTTIGLGPFTNHKAENRVEAKEDRQSRLADKLSSGDITQRFGELDF